MNVSKAAVTIEIHMIDAVAGNDVDSWGPGTLDAGGVRGTTYYGSQRLLYGRFVHASKAKLRASLNVNDANGDYTDSVVVPAE